jgi:hypothetical protein
MSLSVACSSRTCLKVSIPRAPHPSGNQDAKLVSDVGESDQPIPLPNVSSSVLKKVYTSQLCDSSTNTPESSSTKGPGVLRTSSWRASACPRCRPKSG